MDEPLPEALERVLFTAAAIRERVAELGRQICIDYAPPARELTVVAVLNGSILFLADLIRQLPLPLRVDFVGASSYGSGTASAGAVTLTRGIHLDLAGRDVLLIDDILDTGLTLHALGREIARAHPGSLRTCVLLDKPARRRVPIQADYVGFTIADAFVVGYGLDYQERYRNLPYIAVLRPPAGAAGPITLPPAPA